MKIHVQEEQPLCASPDIDPNFASSINWIRTPKLVQEDEVSVKSAKVC